MMIRIYAIIIAIITFAACNSSQSNKKDNQETTKVDTTEVLIPNNKSTPKDLVQNKNITSLNDAQQQVQLLLKSCVDGDYEIAAKTIMYLGADESRLNKDHFNYQNIKEAGTVKVTCEVLSEWLDESENYEFVSYSSDTTDMGIEYKVEVLFKKSNLGIERHFFYYKETDKGLLLFNMI